MDIKIILQFLLITFAMVFILTLLSFALYRFDIEFVYRIWMDNTFIGIMPLNLFYALTPAIASYIVLKRYGKVKNAKEWLKNVFHVKSSVFHYMFIAFGLTLYFLSHMIFSDFTDILSIRMFFFFVVLMFLNGGMEETGWRYILQPKLNKKYGFIVACIVTSLIWYIWHLPFFFIPTRQSDLVNVLSMYYVMILSQTVFYGTIIKIAGKSGIFLSILYHTMFNAIHNTIRFLQTWIGTIVASVVIVVFSVIILIVYNRKNQAKHSIQELNKQQ